MTNKEFMFMPRAIVQHNTKISDVINYLENSSEKCILVMNNEKFVGLITKQELPLAIQNIYHPKSATELMYRIEGVRS